MIGPTGQQVRDNIVRLREQRGMTYAEMSRRLEEAGHPIAVLGLRRIEHGERRIDVDDLTALATVFNVDPGTLLPQAPRESPRALITRALRLLDDTAHPDIVDEYTNPDIIGKA